MTTSAQFFSQSDLKRIIALVMLCADCSTSLAQELFSPPLPMNNRTPYTQIFISPTAPNYTLPIRGVHIGAHLDLSSHSVIEASHDTQLELDGETSRLTLDMQYRFSPRWLVRAEAPLVVHSGGFLDGSIDRWHRLTGLPEGERPRQPSNALLFGYRDPDNFSLIASRQRALGDVQLAIAYQVRTHREPSAVPSTWQSTAWTQLTVKLPTGRRRSLTGSGAMDIAASWHYHREQTRAAQPWAISLDAYAMHTAEGGVLSVQKNQQWQLAFKVARQWRPWLIPELQLRYRSAVYDSAVNAIGGPSLGIDVGMVIAGASGSWRLGLSEDLNVDSAPDVGFYLQYHRQLFNP